MPTCAWLRPLAYAAVYEYAFCLILICRTSAAVQRRTRRRLWALGLGTLGDARAAINVRTQGKIKRSENLRESGLRNKTTSLNRHRRRSRPVVIHIFENSTSYFRMSVLVSCSCPSWLRSFKFQPPGTLRTFTLDISPILLPAICTSTAYPRLVRMIPGIE